MTRSAYSKRGIIFLCSLTYFVSYFSRKSFAAVMAGMLAENVLDKSTAGLVGTALFICYGVGQLISGYLGDKMKPSYLILFGLGTTTLCNLLMPLVPDGGWMIPVWGLNGFAQAMLWPPIVRILSDHLNHELFVTANLIVTSAAHVSTILLYLYVPVCLSFMTWETVFFTATALALLAMLVFALTLHFVLPEKPSAKAVPDSAAKDTPNGDKAFLRGVLRAGILPVFGCIVMMGFLRDGIESWLPTLYGEVFGRDSAESVLVSVVLPIFSILSISAITALHRGRLFNNEVRGSGILFALSAVLCVPILFLIGAESVVPRILCLVLTALVCACMHSCNFLLISCLPGRFSKRGKASTVSGFCNACTYVGAAVSMYGIALISDNLGWSATVISFILISAFGVILSLVALRPYTKEVLESENGSV